MRWPLTANLTPAPATDDITVSLCTTTVATPAGAGGGELPCEETWHVAGDGVVRKQHHELRQLRSKKMQTARLKRSAFV